MLYVKQQQRKEEEGDGRRRGKEEIGDGKKEWKRKSQRFPSILQQYRFELHFLYTISHLIILLNITQCYIIPYHIISNHIISYYIISYHTISYHIISYHTIPYHIIPYHIISYHIIPYHTIPYHSMQHNTTQHNSSTGVTYPQHIDAFLKCDAQRRSKVLDGLERILLRNDF